MDKVAVLSVDGKRKGETRLPAVFGTPYRPDIILKAFLAARANRRQAYGPAPMAGAMHSTASAGKGRGLSRVPRIRASNTGALAPPTVGGRRAHPPRPEKVWTQKVNDKERRLAIRSAIAATSQRPLVVARGHRLEEKTVLPLIIESSFEKIGETKEMVSVLQKLGVAGDLERASAGRHVRAGRGKLRGRRVRKPRSLLIVAKNPVNLLRGARNLPGVEIVRPEFLNAERLAPGGTPGRLTLYTEDALKALEAVR